MLADEFAIRYTVLRYRAAVLVPQCLGTRMDVLHI